MRALVLVTTLLLGACANWPWLQAAGIADAGPADYLVNVLAADAKVREGLWQAALQEPDTESGKLHRALLRSVPGQVAYDPVAAEAALKELLSQDPSAGVARVARARLADLQSVGACRADVEELKRRLSKVADIEKRLDKERH